MTAGFTDIREGCYKCGPQADGKRPALAARGEHIVCERCGGGYAYNTPAARAALLGDPLGLLREHPRTPAVPAVPPKPAKAHVVMLLVPYSASYPVKVFKDPLKAQAMLESIKAYESKNKARNAKVRAEHPAGAEHAFAGDFEIVEVDLE